MSWTLAAHLARASTLFGGEDLLLGRPWYHELLALASAQKAGWSAGAAADLAWHARRIDDYLYNPIWRLRGGLTRWRAAQRIGPLLKNLHFDDLSTNDQVIRLWKQYTAGTAAAVLFAWMQDDVPAARNAIGVSLHAMQDFYSHSNWVDRPERRTVAWEEFPAGNRNSQQLWTGSFDSAPTAGTRPHGFLRIGPRWPPRRGPISQHPARLLGMSGLAKLVRAEPGIALDTRWQSRLGIRERMLTGVTGEELFAAALQLAQTTGTAWLSCMHEVMHAAGGHDFWCRVSQSEGCPTARLSQFEGRAGLPFSFAAVGTYPPDKKAGTDATYLRLLLRAEAARPIDVRITSQNRSWLARRNDQLRGTGLHLFGPGPAPVDLVEVRAGVPWVLRNADLATFTRGQQVVVVDFGPGSLDRELRANEWFAIPLRSAKSVSVEVRF